MARTRGFAAYAYAYVIDIVVEKVQWYWRSGEVEIRFGAVESSSKQTTPPRDPITSIVPATLAEDDNIASSNCKQLQVSKRRSV